MANSTVMVDDNSTLSTTFVQQLIPSAERTALLYRLTFLSLGGFPKLERIIRDQAIETQMLFGSSEAVLLKCVITSSNLVTSLFPILKKAVEKNKPALAVRYILKAKEWISDIIEKVDDMVKRYDKHNESVKTCTSDVFEVQKHTEDKIHKQSDEINGLKDAVSELELDLKQIVEKLNMNNEQIERTTNELNDFFRRFAHEHSHWTVRFLNFFRGYPDAMREATAIALDRKLKDLYYEKGLLKNEEWKMKIQLTDLHLQLANCKIRLGAIPDPVHLKEVQLCLSQIQQILIELRGFWKKVYFILEGLKDKTFAGDELVGIGDMKEEFISSIEDAAQYWKRFGMSCQKAHGIFTIESRDAYKFLEINPSSLSEEDRKKQYLMITEKLKKIS